MPANPGAGRPLNGLTPMQRLMYHAFRGDSANRPSETQAVGNRPPDDLAHPPGEKKSEDKAMITKMTMVPFAALLLTFSLGLAPSNTKNKNEVWSIDQSDSAGKTYGGTIYIWNSKDLEKVNKEAVAEKVDLGGAASALCLAQTGANPVRPHMLTMNKASTHAIISFVASGHVLFMNAQTRQPITCIRTSVGSTRRPSSASVFPLAG